MTRTTDGHTTTISNDDTREAGVYWLNSRQHGQWMAAFGRLDRDGSFVCHCRKPSRTYKSERAAERAAVRWASLN